PTRWLQDDAWNHVNTIFNELFIGTSSKNLKQIQNNNTVQQANFISMHYDNIQEKAVDYSLEDNDQQSLDDIILAYISEKQAKREAMAQLETIF
ncbi:7669_t:CDS:2, partial [Rhizophagus irregularis]